MTRRLPHLMLALALVGSSGAACGRAADLAAPEGGPMAVPRGASTSDAPELLNEDGQDIADIAAAAELPALVASGGMASGHAAIHGTTVQGIRDERYSFTAISTTPFPQAKGEVDVHLLTFSNLTVDVHAEVVCMSVVGNQAWIGTHVTHYTVDGQAVPSRLGGPMIFRVLDVGEGEGSTDVASLVFFPAAGGELSHCGSHPAFPLLRESTIGNIQVRPE
jgi:hypothetical protein